MPTPEELAAATAQAACYNDAPGEGFSTVALHHGHKLDADNRARAPPIFQTTSFCFKDSEHGKDLFALAKLGPIYTRIMNPTTHVFEYKCAKLEGAPCKAHGDFDNAATLPNALAVSSGQAAQMHALMTFMQAGDNFIAANELYGGTYSQLKHSFAQIGITAKFFDVTKPEAIKGLADENTKCIYVETISNPSYNIPDFDGIKAIATELKVPLVCDNTFGMCGYVCRPLGFGADIVVESATKWIGGHGTSIGGVIVDGSSFDWKVQKADGSLKFPLIAGPQPHYHDAVFVDHPIFGVGATNTIFILLARVKTLRDMGGAPSPMNSFQLIQGLETLALRGAAHCENANRLAAYLASHPKIKAVSHPSLASHPSHEKANKYFRKGTFGSVLTFEIKGSSAADELAKGKQFMDSTKLCSMLANVGDARTLIIHPASTTHEQMSPDEQKAAGVQPSMVRVSVGFEEYADIEADFEQALKSC
jgi:O-acetylhomoserine/O-acetylserine sulfhydrylase